MSILKFILIVLLLTIGSCKHASEKREIVNKKYNIKKKLNNKYKTIDSGTKKTPAPDTCELKALGYLIGKINSYKRINDQDATFLFQTINPNCSGNFKYVKQINEVLLRVLENSPKQFAFALSANISDEKRVFILKQIQKRSRPLRDTKRVMIGVMNAEDTDSLINNKLMDAIMTKPLN